MPGAMSVERRRPVPVRLFVYPPLTLSQPPAAPERALTGFVLRSSTSRKHIPQDRISSIRGPATRRLASICEFLNCV